MEEILRLLHAYNERNECFKKLVIFPDGSGVLTEHTQDIYHDRVQFESVKNLYKILRE